MSLSTEFRSHRADIRGHKARVCVHPLARLVLYQLATNTAIPDDKSRASLAGVRGQPGPVAGVRPISGGAGHPAWREIATDDCLLSSARLLKMDGDELRAEVTRRPPLHAASFLLDLERSIDCLQRGGLILWISLKGDF